MNGLMQGNFLSAMQGMLEGVEQLADQWEESRTDWDKVKFLLKSETAVLLNTKVKAIFTDLYYGQTIPVSNQLMLHLDKTVEFVEFYSRIMNYSNYILFPLFIALLVAPYHKIMVDYYALFYIFPFCMFEKNPLLMNKIRRIRKSKKFYKG